MHVRTAIALDIVAIIKTISIANGYLTNVDPEKVDHWNVDAYSNDDSEVINVKDKKVIHENGKQTLVIEIGLGAIKGTSTYDFITNRTLDIYNAVYKNISTFKNKYGYFVIRPVEDELEIERNEKTRSESDIKFEVTYKVSEKWEPDNRSFT
ncbi:MAG: hypothetical protein C4539_14565 [Ignavibacteriales bacterium]|nr:MAG: hypothetical protein C4539_14565 [Ignavibacteriales bacterium]